VHIGTKGDIPMEERLEKIEDMLSKLSSKLDDLTDDIESTIEDAVEDAVENAVQDAVEDAMSSKSNTPAVLLTILTQDGKSILPVHAVKARRMKKDAEEYGIFVHWCDNCECAGKYPNKADALAEIEEMCKYVSSRTTQIYKMK
jgi:hypothetical protein